MKTPVKAITDKLYNMGIRFISGKWFYKDNEVKDIKKYIWNMPDISQFLNNVQDSANVIDLFIERFGEPDSLWPEMPIIEEARQWITDGKVTEPVFPLTRKHRLLIRKLIEGKEEFMFIMCGVGGSGKSTFANIICQIFNRDVASLTLADLSNDFKLASGVNSRLVYADELNSEDLDNGMIKTLISKQKITVNPKFEKGYQLTFQGTLLFSCNKAPYLDLSDSGIVRRICYVFFNNKIEHPDLTLQKKVYTHEELVNIVANSLLEDDTNWFNEFKIETHDLLRNSSSVWLCKGHNLKDTYYYQYQECCKDKGLRSMSEPKWTAVRELLMQWEGEDNEILEDLPF